MNYTSYNGFAIRHANNENIPLIKNVVFTMLKEYGGEIEYLLKISYWLIFAHLHLGSIQIRGQL